MIEVEPGIYEYEYNTLIEAATQLMISVNDTDRTIDLELPVVQVVKNAVHKHKYVDGVCSCGAKDPNYEEPVHEHKFVDGVCACGEKEPTTDKPDTPSSGGGMNCNMGFVSLLPLLAAATLLLIRKKR